MALTSAQLQTWINKSPENRASFESAYAGGNPAPSSQPGGTLALGPGGSGSGQGGLGPVHYGPENGGITVQDYGGGQMDNLLRAGLMRKLGGNPYFPQQPGGNTGTTTQVQPGATQLNGGQQGGQQYGLSGFENAVNNALEGATSYINNGMTQATGYVQDYSGKAVDSLSPYAQGGVNANKLQADLSGANGPEAQSAAWANYQSSPEQAYLREMGQKGILQNAAALGGLHGSNVMQELQRHGVGLAAQDYGNYFNRLNDPANRGAAASSGIADIYSNTGNALAGIAAGGNQQIADYNMRAGEGIGATRYDAGQALSSNIGAVTSAISSLTADQGTQLAELMGLNANQLATLTSAAGQGDAESIQTLISLLTNINQTSSGQAAGLPTMPGIDINPGQISNVGNFLGGLGSFTE